MKVRTLKSCARRFDKRAPTVGSCRSTTRCRTATIRPGFSFSQAPSRSDIGSRAATKGFLIVEDAPYVYISYAEAVSRGRNPFFAMAPDQTVHSVHGLQDRVSRDRGSASFYSQAILEIADGERVSASPSWR